MIEGWYYLHINGDLIYRGDLDGTAADIRESDFARGLWSFDSDHRLGAWTILVEALASGARESRIDDLSSKWGCDDSDAENYAQALEIVFELDGDQWCAHHKEWDCLANSPAGFGKSKLYAAAELAKAYGYKPTKMWGYSFQDLLKGNSHVNL